MDVLGDNDIFEEPDKNPPEIEEEVTVEKSILLSTKKNLGLSPDVDQFDPDIIMCINSAFNILTQLGVGPEEGFQIVSKNDVWEKYLNGNLRINMVKSYIFLKTKMLFDPPTISAVLESYKEQIKEYESRLNYEVDPRYTFE